MLVVPVNLIMFCFTSYRLAAVTARLAELESAFNAAVAKKDALQAKEEQCKIQLVNADRLIGGLGGEEVRYFVRVGQVCESELSDHRSYLSHTHRWRETVNGLATVYTNVTGDVLVAAGTISYLGPFTYDFRSSIVEGWQVGR